MSKKETQDIYVKIGCKARRLESLEAGRLIFRATEGGMSIMFYAKIREISEKKG